ncbi:MAG: precorrin-6y C5,15-methyltransferase (decarboxylating) subunit CbiE [Tissierellia bacterium]|nr:precorrin-6y C5,15-methyltransferase (decarboxylating) subunit CbiE [Tissierellia bacterium]
MVAGVGPGNPKYMISEVAELVENMENVVAFGRVSKGLNEIRDDIKSVVKVSELNDLINEYDDLLILASGDPEFYGVTDYLKRSGIVIDRVVPGISSFQYLMCKLQKSWQNTNLFSLHGRDYELSEVLNNEMNICLTDSINTPNSISKSLYELGARGSITAGYNLSYDDELIISKKIGDTLDDISALAVVVIEIEMD